VALDYKKLLQDLMLHMQLEDLVMEEIKVLQELMQLKIQVMVEMQHIMAVVSLQEQMVVLE